MALQNTIAALHRKWPINTRTAEFKLCLCYQGHASLALQSDSRTALIVQQPLCVCLHRKTGLHDHCCSGTVCVWWQTSSHHCFAA
jgi:hypothetical protein